MIWKRSAVIEAQRGNPEMELCRNLKQVVPRLLEASPSEAWLNLKTERSFPCKLSVWHVVFRRSREVIHGAGIRGNKDASRNTSESISASL